MGAGGGQVHGRVRPGFWKVLLARRSLVILALCFERLPEAEKRPTVVPVVIQVLPVNDFSLGGAASLEQYGAEHVARRHAPVGRLGVNECIVVAHGPVKMLNSHIVLMFLRGPRASHAFGSD